MGDMENWCTNQTAKLLNEELRIESLQEILDHLSNIPRDEAIRTTRHLELSAVFDCLNDTNSTQVELACDVLTVCMSNLSLGDTTNRYSNFLERALNHPNDSVKIMALREILRNSANEDSLMILINQNNLLHMTIKCVGNENLSVAKEAIAILINIVKSSDGIQKLLSPDSISIINDIMSTNEIIRLRFNEMFINGAKESEKFMKGLIVTGLLPKFVSELDSPDDLLKLNIVELLTELAITEHGYLYLESAGVIGKIYNQFNTDDAIWSDLCKPGILKFFGNIAFWRPKETLDKYPEIINNIFSNIESNNLILLGVSLDTVGHIAERNEGKLALSSRGDQFITVLQVMCDRLSSLPADLRIRALRCIESLIKISVFNSDITSLIHQWFSLMNENSMDLIYKNAKNPFIDIRLAGLSVLNAMALHTWGHECCRETPGFVEFLLDRRSESAKECKEIKYDIIKILSTSTLFEHNTLSRFQEYVQEGPFYVQAITQVAVEGED